jgi:FkbM family methyltransferase
MSHPFVFRPGTHDEAMFHHLTSHNEYRLPDRFGPEEIVVDVGVHIGSFCYSALRRGARRVYGYEAEPSNYACAARNLESFGDRVRLRNKAVWRSDRAVDRLWFTPSDDPSNTGGGTVVWRGNGPGVEAIPFDEVIRDVTEDGRRRITLLKIDCEGSEFPILLTARRLASIDRIAGEFHEIGCAANPQEIPEQARVPGVDQFTIEALVDALRRAGFDVTWERHGQSSLGLFYAARRSPVARLKGRLKTIWHHLNHAARPRAGRPAGVGAEMEKTPR